MDEGKRFHLVRIYQGHTYCIVADGDSTTHYEAGQ